MSIAVRRLIGSIRRAVLRLRYGRGGGGCRALHLGKCLDAVLDEVKNGTLTTVSGIRLRAHDLFSEAATSAGLARDLFADAFGWFALLDEIQNEFETELELVEVPEQEFLRISFFELLPPRATAAL
jgi:propanediol dehydratase small subunit